MAESVDIDLGGSKPPDRRGEQPQSVLVSLIRETVVHAVEHATYRQYGIVGSLLVRHLINAEVSRRQSDRERDERIRAEIEKDRGRSQIVSSEIVKQHRGQPEPEEDDEPMPELIGHEKQHVFGYTPKPKESHKAKYQGHWSKERRAMFLEAREAAERFKDMEFDPERFQQYRYERAQEANRDLPRIAHSTHEPGLPNLPRIGYTPPTSTTAGGGAGVGGGGPRGPLPTPATPPGGPVGGGPPVPILPIVLAAAIGAVAIKELAAAAIRAKERLDEIAEELAPFNQRLTEAQAEGEVSRLLSDIRRARRIGNDLADFTRQSTFAGNQVRETVAAVLQVVMPTINRNMETVNDVLTIVRRSAEMVAAFFEKVEELRESPIIGKIIKATEDGPPHMKGMRDALEWIADWLRRNEPDHEAEFLRQLDDFLNPAHFLRTFEREPGPSDIKFPSRRGF